MELPYGKLGHIVASPDGGYNGWFIRIDADAGFSIFFFRDPRDPTAESYDSWVETEEELVQYLREYQINWAENGTALD